tara:strand:+ start:24 stop:482 length:459 start_codon:yes stop_codon:yes gene_type:complete
MPAGEYDILAEQGSTFVLSLTYKDSSDNAIDMEGYTGSMQVRRSVSDNQVLLHLTGPTGAGDTTVTSGSVTGGGSTGEFTLGGGTHGTGGIRLNTSSVGATGTTGGIYITVDAETMANVPSGNHVYDLELKTGTTVDRILSGRFEVVAEVTR